MYEVLNAQFVDISRAGCSCSCECSTCNCTKLESMMGDASRAGAGAAGNSVGDSIDPATRRELGKFLERDGRSRLRFRNAMTRDVAYEGLSFRRRRQLHLRAGALAESEAGDSAADIADLLAMHFWMGGEYRKAWHYSQVAGDSAKDAYANVDAAANYERALDASSALS